MKVVKQLTQAVAKGYTSAVTREQAGEVPIQTGALPWRLAAKNGIEVLLVTGRRSGRWTIPKGWPMPGKTLAEAAAQEAFEEAGVKGTIDPTPIGTFRHVKQLTVVGDLEVDIVVHPLWVDRELEKWPEFGQRKRKWFKPKEAAKRVDSPELSEMIRQSVKKPLRH
ncbi:MAG TPA: NUDIX hydrolase [Sphingomicrobium sp.]|jgi:8-oxo-dGTP pyrophosphatase MutT (NUDIX family)